MAEKILSPNEFAAAVKRGRSKVICDQLFAELLPLEGNARNWRKEARVELICRHYPGMDPSRVKRMTDEDSVPFLSKIAEKVRRDQVAQSPAGPSDEEPPLLERVLDLLTPQQGKIFEAIHSSKTQSMGFGALAKVPKAWRGWPSDEAIKQALTRINKTLAENADLAVELSISVVKRRVKLEFLRDK